MTEMESQIQDINMASFSPSMEPHVGLIQGDPAQVNEFMREKVLKGLERVEDFSADLISAIPYEALRSVVVDCDLIRLPEVNVLRFLFEWLRSEWKHGRVSEDQTKELLYGIRWEKLTTEDLSILADYSDVMAGNMRRWILDEWTDWQKQLNELIHQVMSSSQWIHVAESLMGIVRLPGQQASFQSKMVRIGSDLIFVLSCQPGYGRLEVGATCLGSRRARSPAHSLDLQLEAFVCPMRASVSGLPKFIAGGQPVRKRALVAPEIEDNTVPGEPHIVMLINLLQMPAEYDNTTIEVFVRLFVN